MATLGEARVVAYLVPRSEPAWQYVFTRFGFQGQTRQKGHHLGTEGLGEQGLKFDHNICVAQAFVVENERNSTMCLVFAQSCDIMSIFVSVILVRSVQTDGFEAVPLR